MKKQLTAGKTDWSDPGLSDEEDGSSSDEISFDEEEPVAEVETQQAAQADPNLSATAPVQSQTALEQLTDSFNELMKGPPDVTGPSGSAGEGIG